MKTVIPYIILISTIVFLWSGLSCKKYLNKKPQQSLTIPSTPEDLQALLDYGNVMNSQTPADMCEILADNIYVTKERVQFLTSASQISANIIGNYLWKPDVTYLNSWRYAYEYPVKYSNNVLSLLPDIKMDAAIHNRIRGAALFYRAFAFYSLAQLYCKPYSATADTELGIVLRLNNNINEVSVRSTVQQTYDQILNDLKEASNLLSPTSLFVSQPNKAAAYGMLARVYLSMRDYVQAGHYADLCLKLKNTLMDFNTIKVPIAWNNPEVIFYHIGSAEAGIEGPPGLRVDTLLYKSYQQNDLRKTFFFKEYTVGNADNHSFQGAYVGGDGASQVYHFFDGLATDELYLIRAECFAQAGNTEDAMADLNVLLQARWKAGTWEPFTASNSTVALHLILQERRKELCYRGLRWTDLRRLNLDGAGIELRRVVGIDTFLLPPNDLRWVLLIPREVINLSGIQQNPR